MDKSLQEIVDQAVSQLDQVSDLKQVDEIRVQYLGKKGI
ncbi:MAG: phenylalanine--tRNA ligase subunit alpha, partial [Gammaproteobacteria bacterium]